MKNNKGMEEKISQRHNEKWTAGVQFSYRMKKNNYNLFTKVLINFYKKKTSASGGESMKMASIALIKKKFIAQSPGTMKKFFYTKKNCICKTKYSFCSREYWKILIILKVYQKCI